MAHRRHACSVALISSALLVLVGVLALLVTPQLPRRTVLRDTGVASVSGTVPESGIGIGPARALLVPASPQVERALIAAWPLSAFRPATRWLAEAESVALGSTRTLETRWLRAIPRMNSDDPPRCVART